MSRGCGGDFGCVYVGDGDTFHSAACNRNEELKEERKLYLEAQRKLFIQEVRLVACRHERADLLLLLEEWANKGHSIEREERTRALIAEIRGRAG